MRRISLHEMGPDKRTVACIMWHESVVTPSWIHEFCRPSEDDIRDALDSISLGLEASYDQTGPTWQISPDWNGDIFRYPPVPKMNERTTADGDYLMSIWNFVKAPELEAMYTDISSGSSSENARREFLADYFTEATDALEEVVYLIRTRIAEITSDENVLRQLGNEKMFVVDDRGLFEYVKTDKSELLQ